MLASLQTFEAKWKDTTAAMTADLACVASPELTTFNSMVEAARDKEGPDRIGFINKSVNDLIRYQIDPDDIWQSPLTTIRLGTGDCEDYAILKYALLKSLGVIDIKLVIGIIPQSQIAHAITIVKLDDWFVMDNRFLVLPKLDDIRSYFHPEFYLSDTGVEMATFTLSDYLNARHV